jgi:hypothetical protein
MVSDRLSAINDTREKGKTEHCLHDVAMSGLAMMFFQDPSLLQFQRRMEEAKQTSNLKSLLHAPLSLKILACVRYSMRLTPII